MTIKTERIAPADLNALLGVQEDPFAGLKPVGTNIEKMETDLAQAAANFDKQFQEMLQEMRYYEVVAMLGPNPNFHPCDDYAQNCSLMCDVFSSGCPYAPKVAIPEEPKKEKKSRRRRKKASAAGGSKDRKTAK